ncbi:MAG TPA: hypothetical protein VET85_10440 [Stellaceae bacterium]|nr:hypothetical protein [Stellaceae bacterium]
MRKSLLLTPIAAMALFAAPALAQQFSADMVQTGPHASREGAPLQQKIYVADGKMRAESGGPTGRVMIADGKTKTAFMVMPQQKSYVEMHQMGRMTAGWAMIDANDACPQWQQMAKNSGRKESEGWTCKRLGSETVNGRTAVKYEATAPDGGMFHAWVDPKLSFMIKTQGPEGDGMELRNIQEGPQSASLFEPPADYRKIEMPAMPRQAMPPPPSNATPPDDHKQ